jgi:hypothetical protein
MAYLLHNDVSCDWPYCAGKATQILYDNTDKPVGKYCWQHARVSLAKQQRKERDDLNKHGPVLR